jgi:hypothetical protein
VPIAGQDGLPDRRIIERWRKRVRKDEDFTLAVQDAQHRCALPTKCHKVVEHTVNLPVNLAGAPGLAGTAQLLQLGPLVGRQRRVAVIGLVLELPLASGNAQDVV